MSAATRRHDASPEVLASVLEDAARLIESTSLVKGISATYDRHGCPTGYCATGAVSEVVTDEKLHASTMEQAVDALAYVAAPENVGQTSMDACQAWNDKIERTAAEVAWAMRKAAWQVRRDGPVQ